MGAPPGPHRENWRAPPPPHRENWRSGALFVAHRSEYTRYSSLARRPYRENRVSRAPPRPHRENWPGELGHSRCSRDFIHRLKLWNAREFARAIGRGEAAARRHLDLVVGAFVVRTLPPWFENLKKRQVRSPKIYVRDSGLLHTLLDIPSLQTLSGHPKIGASFEGFAIEQILSTLSLREAYMWGTHGGAELDLLVFCNARRYGFEIQYTDAPRTTRSMRIAISDLGLERLFVVHPGEDCYLLDDAIEALPVRCIPALSRRPEFAAG